MLRFDHAYPLFSKGIKAIGLMATLGAALSGCGFRFAEPREPWRGQAEAACMRSGIVKPSAFIRQTKPIDGPGPCGADLPLKVSAFEVNRDTLMATLAATGAQEYGLSGLSNTTSIKPEATLGCPMVAWTDDWIAGSVQPAALAWFGQGVREIRAGSYACRRRNHRANARLSEHAFGNALDIMSFVLSDGNVVTVKGGWRGSEQEQGFLRDVFHGACERFKTVLGPGSDALHYDHFHLDLAHHNAGGTRRYCKPQVAAPRRPLPGTYGPGANPPMPPLNAMAPATPGMNQRMMAGGAPAWNAPPQLAARPAPSFAPPTPLPARSGSTLDSAPPNEIEPDFDPSAFDLATGSIPELPEPKVAPAPRKPRAGTPANRQPARGGALYDPAGRN